MKSDTYREKLKGKREVYRRSDGRQELQSCTCSGISQAANGVHTAVMLYGLAFVFSERAELHCSELFAVDLFVPQANRPILSCSNSPTPETATFVIRKISVMFQTA